MADDAVGEFAQRLRDLKERAGRSYTGLAARAALSRSTVHRYCSGAAVPQDFDSVSRLARACGADRDELLDLHRIWALASAVTRDGAGADQVLVSVSREVGADVDPSGTASAAVAGPATPATLAAAGPYRTRPRSRRYLSDLLVALIAAFVSLLALNAFGGFTWPGNGPGAAPDAELAAGTAEQILFSEACVSVISLGEHDECVQQVQTLLSESGTTLTVDANFGLETLRRVIAFQAIAGLPPTGAVDNATKHALVSGQASMWTWSDKRVERRIREVFRDSGAGDEAVQAARCHSHLDALWVGLNPDGSHRWGVFQLSDAVLDRYDGTPHLALDPEWNIQAAHWIWAEHRDFRDWAGCVDPAGTADPSAARPARPDSGESGRHRVARVTVERRGRVFRAPGRA